MKSDVNILEKTTEAELTITVSVEEMAPFVDSAVKRIAKEVKVDGFRKGKVPREVLAEKIGGEQAFYQEAFNDVVEDTYPKAVDEHDLQVVGRANIDVEKMAPGNDLVYKATVPLMPKIKLGKYQSLKVKKKEAEMDQEKYDKTIEDLREMRAKEKVVTRAAASGDKTIIDFVVKIDGVPIEGGSGQGQPLKLGGGQFIPGFEEAVTGMKKDEEKDFKVTFPKDYHKTDLQNRKADVHVKLNEVYEMELPALDDEFAKSLNFESLEFMEKELKANIIKEEEGKVQQKFEEAVTEEIVKKAKFDPIPAQLIEEETKKMVSELQGDISQQGLQFDDYLTHLGKTEEELQEDFKDKAELRIKAALVLREVAVAEDIKVTEDDLKKEVEELKKAYKDTPQMIEMLESPDYRSRMENILIHRKTFEKLTEYCKK